MITSHRTLSSQFTSSVRVRQSHPDFSKHIGWWPIEERRDPKGAPISEHPPKVRQVWRGHRDQTAPVHRPSIVKLDGSHHQLAHGRGNPVSPHHQIVVTARSITE